jgi:hypothetical protein
MKYAFVNDNEIKKIEEWESLEQIIDGHLFQHVIDITGFQYQPQVGWTFDNGKLFLKLAPVTARQIRRALLSIGLTEATILGALNTLPEPTKSAALIEWEYSNEFFRTHYLVGMVGQMLGWNTKQLDDLWVLASTL